MLIEMELNKTNKTKNSEVERNKTVSLLKRTTIFGQCPVLIELLWLTKMNKIVESKSMCDCTHCIQCNFYSLHLKPRKKIERKKKWKKKHIYWNKVNVKQSPM